MDADLLERSILELCHAHGPSGDEGEVDKIILDALSRTRFSVRQDACGNIIATAGDDSSSKTLLITAHKDEIGALVERVDDDGRLHVVNLGASHPWVYGEGVVDILGDRETISGVLSFGCRHVERQEPQASHQKGVAVTWDDATIATFLRLRDLEAAGVRPGSRVVVGKHRKTPLLFPEYIAGYALDDRVGVAVLLLLAQCLGETTMRVVLAFTAMEELGGFGAAYLARSLQPDALIALEIVPLSDENAAQDPHRPVVVVRDGHAPYDISLLRTIAALADEQRIPFQFATLRRFGSDASHTVRLGLVARSACLGFPAQNTHGYEIASRRAIAALSDLITACSQSQEICG